MDLEEVRRSLAAYQAEWERAEARARELEARVEDFERRAAQRTDPQMTDPAARQREQEAALLMKLSNAQSRQLVLLNQYLLALAEAMLNLHERVEALEQRAA